MGMVAFYNGSHCVATILYGQRHLQTEVSPKRVWLESRKKCSVRKMASGAVRWVSSIVYDRIVFCIESYPVWLFFFRLSESLFHGESFSEGLYFIQPVRAITGVSVVSIALMWSSRGAKLVVGTRRGRLSSLKAVSLFHKGADSLNTCSACFSTQ